MPASRTAVRAVAQTLSTDMATAEACAALTGARIESLVLRGPAVARELYPDAVRTYVDLDLLVDPDAWPAAGDVLRGLGFEPLTAERDVAGHRPVHAFEWWRASDHVAIDLHRTLSGASAPPAEVFAVLWEASEEAELAGARVRLLNRPALALVVALHAAHHGPGRSKPLDDLELGLSIFEQPTWVEAARLARRLEAVDAFAAGLRLAPAGVAMARGLGLAESASPDVVLRSEAAPPLALGLNWFLGQTWRARARLLLGVLAPRPGALKSWRMLARRGRRGLVLAYLSQPFWLLRHLPASIRAVRRARRSAA